MSVACSSTMQILLEEAENSVTHFQHTVSSPSENTELCESNWCIFLPQCVSQFLTRW